MKSMKKGFTLIELLAVIVILAIVALIATPIVLDVIGNAKDKANMASSYGIIDTAKLYYIENKFKDGVVPSTNIIDTLNLGGDKPETGEVYINKTGEIAVSLKYGDKCYKKEFGDENIKTSEYNINSCKTYVPSNVVKDESNASVPNLHANMIPIKYDGSKWVKADMLNTSKEWFDYENQKWANAVTVTTSSRETYKSAAIGTEVLEADILTYMVWIPRYEYKIDGLYGKGGTSTSNPGEIEINFASISSGYRVHPGFTFGSEELAGFWMGKFELTGTIGAITVKPNVTSLRSQTISSFFSAMRNLDNNPNYGYGNVESHMIKNSEWGAVAYLSQSKYGKYGNASHTGANKEIYQNKSSTYITGNSNGTPSQVETNTQCAYNDHTNNCGIGASTTGTIYGIYDMSGGAYEYVMGNLNNTIGDAGFALMPEVKYYDLYTNSTVTTACFDAICYGHALTETGSWYSDNATFVTATHTWLARGGSSNIGIDAGVFYSYYIDGSNTNVTVTSRITHK